MIQIRQLTKVYEDWERGPQCALSGITLQAEAGEVYGILGPNGAGKTTLLRILGTILRPSTGSATINGFDLWTQPSGVRRSLGFVSSHASSYDRMTAQEIVEYFGRLHDIPEATLRARLQGLFRQLDMLDFRDTPSGKLSTGMRQKVAIARALIHDPPVIVFDEATSGLDVLAARALLQIVRQLRQQGKCILFATHIMREAEKLCDRIVILHQGHVFAEGPLHALLKQYQVTDLEELFFQLIWANSSLECVPQPAGVELRSARTAVAED